MQWFFEQPSFAKSENRQRALQLHSWTTNTYMHMEYTHWWNMKHQPDDASDYLLLSDLSFSATYVRIISVFEAEPHSVWNVQSELSRPGAVRIWLPSGRTSPPVNDVKATPRMRRSGDSYKCKANSKSDFVCMQIFGYYFRWALLLFQHLCS